MPSALQYQPLARKKREIRLITLSPRESPEIEKIEVVRCFMRHASLNDRPDYVALSYTWGDLNNTLPIFVDGATLPVTVNLVWALQQFQPTAGEPGVTIWVDAVCINQGDDAEKSWQVQMMHTIYENAYVVLIWLGPEADGSDNAFKKLEIAGKEAAKYEIVREWECRFWSAKWIGEQLPPLPMGRDEPTIVDVLSGFTVNDSDDTTIPLTATLALLSRQWWQRVWVLQELAAAELPLFVCGSKMIPAEYMSSALTVFRLYLLVKLGALYQGPDDFLPVDVDSRPFTMLSFRVSPKDLKPPLILLLRGVCAYTMSNRRLNASDPKDFIYALLGLCGDAEKLGISLDYSKSCADVFIDCMKSLVVHYSANCLSLCFFPKLRADLPTWVPDWSACPRNHRLLVGQGEDGQDIEFGPNKMLANINPHFSSSKNFPEARGPQDRLEYNILPLLGIRVDEIHDILKREIIEDSRVAGIYIG
jgi:hypothetical protein